MNSIANYDSSSDEEETCLKRKALDDIEKSTPKMPKLPSFFDTTLPITSLVDKQGRKRTVPHKKNSWATYVYFQVDLSQDKPNILKYCKGLEEIDEQHISLSRTVYLKQHQLDSFIKSIDNKLKSIKSFDLSFAQIAQLTNDEKTRSFVTLEVGKGYNELLNCLGYIDNVMLEYNQPVFYDPPRFHTSIAWSLKERDIQLLNIPESCIDNMLINSFHITRLYIKQGHLVHHIDLL